LIGEAERHGCEFWVTLSSSCFNAFFHSFDVIAFNCIRMTSSLSTAFAWRHRFQLHSHDVTDRNFTTKSAAVANNFYGWRILLTILQRLAAWKTRMKYIEEQCHNEGWILKLLYFCELLFSYLYVYMYVNIGFESHHNSQHGCICCTRVLQLEAI
jgi:hypothetical protein